MLRRIPFTFATRTLIAIQGVALSYHALIVTGVVAFEHVWGGRLQSRQQMLRFESVSVGINLVMLAVILIRAGIWKTAFPQKPLSILCWIFSGLFALNTAGNLTAQSAFEAIVFTPLTLASSVLFARLAIGRATAP